MRINRVRARLIVAAVLSACLASSAAASQPARCTLHDKAPNAAAELDQFAFLIGDFTVSLHAWAGSDWSPPRPVPARWNGWYGLSGTVIVDEWYDPPLEIDPNAGRGVNVRLYDAEAGLWKMMWVASTGRQVQDLRAQMQDGQLTMWQVYPERKGWKAVFEVADDNRWSRISYLEQADGSWLPEFKLAATRVPCGG